MNRFEYDKFQVVAYWGIIGAVILTAMFIFSI